MQDDITWAMDGMNSPDVAAQEESIAALVELLGSRRGKLFLQKEDIAHNILEKLGS